MGVTEFIGPWVFDLFFGAYGRWVGQPWQQARARRLARRGKIRSVLFEPSLPTVIRGRLIDGAAEVWEGRIRLWDADLWIHSVEPEVERGPKLKRGDGDLLFRPPTVIYTLHTHRGTVKWAVLESQAEHALSLLKLESAQPERHDL